jgi:hypothetical protein
MGKDVDSYYKKMVDEIYSKQKWAIEEADMQDLYETILFNLHYEFCHSGHAYFITFDTNEEKKEVWVIYDRDFSDPKIAYKSDWDIEKRVDYKDLPSLIFEFELKNDGRTIAEYCYDYWNQPRKLIPEPIDYKYKRKML